MSNEELVYMIQSGINVKENMGILWEQVKNFTAVRMSPYFKETGKTAGNDRIYADDVAGNSDIMQEAFLIMSDAVHKFDRETGYTFLTYYGTCLKNIYRYFKENGKNKRLPEHIQTRISKYRKLEAQGLTSDQIRKKMKLKQKQYDQLMELLQESEVSIYGTIPGSDGDSTTLVDTLPCNIDFMGEVIDRITLSEIWKYVGELENDRQQSVITKKYRDGQTPKEIAADLGVAYSRIGQLEHAAIEKLRQMEKIQELARLYDYDSHTAYSTGMNRLKSGKGSTVEFLAIKRMELQQEYQTLKGELNR